PFQAATPLDTILQVLDREPERPSRLRPGVDRDLETVCLKCLHKEPPRRYDSAAALADDLERWLRHEPILARPAPGWEGVARWARRRPGVGALSAAVVLIALAGFAGVLWQWREAEQARLREADRVEEAEGARQAEQRRADAERQAREEKRLALEEA